MKYWYKESFGEDYLLVYQHRSKEQAEQEVKQFIQWLALKPNDRILDLCCGSGRHTISLAELGYHVVGIDLSETLLESRSGFTRIAGDLYSWRYAPVAIC